MHGGCSTGQQIDIAADAGSADPHTDQQIAYQSCQHLLFLIASQPTLTLLQHACSLQKLMELLVETDSPHAALDHVSSSSYTKSATIIGESDLTELREAVQVATAMAVVVDESTGVDSHGYMGCIVVLFNPLAATVTE